MKLFIDDIRQPYNESWTLATTNEEVVNFVNLYGDQITDISFDHDISIGIIAHGLNRPYPSPETFKVAAWYVARYYHARRHVAVPNMTTHSSNPDGRKAIIAIFKDVLGVECANAPLPNCARKQP